MNYYVHSQTSSEPPALCVKSLGASTKMEYAEVGGDDEFVKSCLLLLE